MRLFAPYGTILIFFSKYDIYMLEHEYRIWRPEILS